MRRKLLAVIGAGPKGLAVAVKAKVLEEFGLPVDKVILIERHSVGAHWTGEVGYTNGEMKLGTSPEKDIVFPIETDVGDPILNQKIRQRLLSFTWTSYLVEKQIFSDWVDRGRPAPCHKLWAAYLKWVAGKLSPGTILNAEVVEIDYDSVRWNLNLRGTGPVISTLEVDGLMLTGPGKARTDFSFEKDSRVFDLETFWSAISEKKFRPLGKLAIIGAGENAASVLLALSKFSDLSVDVIAPKGFVVTRSENFYENRIYTHPDRSNWKELDIADRQDFIDRTDLGVFSVHAMQILNQEVRHTIVPGRLKNLHSKGPMICLDLEYTGKKSMAEYDQVILATGFDPIVGLKSMLSTRALATIEKQTGIPLSHPDLRAHIGEDLSLKGLPLFLPMLAGISQGPGFANLSCLGRLSDRVVLSQMHQPTYQFAEAR